MTTSTTPAELDSGRPPRIEQPSAEPYTAPLSFAQLRLWFLYRLEPESPAYNLAAAVHLSGPLHERALHRSLQQIVHRHEALRTTFAEVDGRPVQVIHAAATVVLPVHDLQGLTGAEQQSAIQERASEEARQPFDLVHGPLLRVRLLKLGPAEHVFVVVMHHIVSDGWSIGIFIRELAELYEAFSKGDPCPLPPLPIQYVDFAHWQRDHLQGEKLAEHLAYWRAQLDGAPAILELPADHPRAAVQTFRGAVEAFSLPRRLAARLNALSRREGCTLFMTLLAAFKVLLYRYTSQEDLVVGTPIANRNRVEIESLIGLFVNTLVLRSTLSGNPSFRELLQRVRETALDAFAHQDLPFEKLMEELHPVRNLSHTPLFQVMFAMENAPEESLELAGLKATILELDSGAAKFDLTLSVHETPQGLTGSFEYNNDLFDAATIRRMIGHFGVLLDAIVADPDQPVSTVPLLTPAEEQQLLIEFNDTAQEVSPDERIDRRFEAQVERTPNAIAAVCGQQRLTFAELNDRANRLARYLRRRGIGPNVLVGVCAERSLEMLTGILAVLKAGGAYVPMDPGYPKERLAFMLRDTGARMLLTQEKLRSRLPVQDTEVICLDEPLPEWTGYDDLAEGKPDGVAALDTLAYVIYTSGSTGRPKGILISHSGLANYLAWCTSAYAVRAGEGAPVHSSISFDLTITALFPPLLAGRPVELLPEGPGIESLSVALERRRDFSLIKITPLHLEMLRHEILPQQAAGLTRAFVIGGENLLAADLAFWQEAAPETALVNEYGPTETVVGCCIYQQRSDGRRTGSVPIGRPIANTQLYVLDRNLQPAPIGVPGELFVGGMGLAWGYLNRPDLTAEKFIPNPFAKTPGSRLYRTGDLVRHLSDGNLEYLGRVDNQVKIRGYRIELGEIEAVLREHRAVSEAVATARQDASGNRRLVAYVVPRASQAPSPDELQQELKERLPDYMLPAAVVVLDALPLSSNGKVDYSRLPDPDIARPEREGELVAPRSPAEALLERIWADVLHLDRVGVHDNFFELGGDSILCIQVVAKSVQAGLHITPKQLFQRQTIAELAQAAAADSPVVRQQDPVTGPAALTPVQHWFFEQNLANPHHWNQSVLMELDPSVSASQVEVALRQLIFHHDALRLRFERAGTGWRQTIAAPGETVLLTRVNLAHLSESERAATMDDAAARSQAGLDLGRGPVLRAAFFDFGRGESARLLLVVHHLVIDAISWRILLEDLQTLCRQIRSGGTLELPAKTSSFKDWAERLTAHAGSLAVRNEASYWLADAHTPLPGLPVDHRGGLNTEASLASVSVALSPDDTRALLQQLPKIFHAQINDALLAAVALAFRQWMGSGSMLLHLEGHGREGIFDDVDLSRTIGWFTTIFPMRLDLNIAAGNPEEALQSVKRQRQQIPNGGLGYGLLRYLSGDPELCAALRRIPEAEVIFNYLGQLDQSPAGGSLARPIAIDNGGERSPDGRRTHLLDITAHVSGGVLNIEWSYSRNIHREDTVARLAQACVEGLRSVARQCGARIQRRPLPSDFPLADLTQTQMNTVLARVCDGTRQLPSDEIEDIYPLSSTQQGILFHGLHAPDSGAYFEQLTATLTGDLDVPAFERAWRRVAEREPIFRTAFVWEEGLKEPVQVVSRHAVLPVEIEDWRDLTRAEQHSRLESFLQRDRAHSFRLSEAPLARIALFRLTEDSQQFTFSFHHLLMDGWSAPLLFREFFALYEALRTGSGVEPEPNRPYSDYIAWLKAQDPSKLEAYWRQTLKGITSPTRLKGTAARRGKADSGAAYGRQTVRLSEAATTALQSLARRSHITLNSLLLGAWALVLNKHSDTDDMICGVTVAGRPSELPGVENMLGLFINTLPMRIQVDWQADMLSWCRSLQERQVEWRQYEYSPLVQVHGWSEVPRSQPLFETIFVFENYPVDDSFLSNSGDLSVGDVQFVDQASYPLSVMVVPDAEMLLGIGYYTALLGDSYVAGMLADFRTLLERLIEEPSQKVSQLTPRAAHPTVLASEPDPSQDDCSDIYERSNLTRHQVLIWLGQKLQPEIPLYNLCVPFTIPVAINPEHFRRAFRALVDRTDALRTVVEEIDGVPQQSVLSNLTDCLETLDFSSFQNPGEALRSWIEERRRRPFRLNERLFDVALVKTATSEFTWYLNQHHIISDGWSIKLLFDTLAELYGRSVEGRAQEAREVRRFQKYVEHERCYRSSERCTKAAAYWKEKLSGNPGSIAFYGRPSIKNSAKIRRSSYQLGENLSRKLRAAAEGIPSTTIDAALFNVFASILCAWIYRSSQQRAFRVGITSHNRTSPEFKETAGFFMQVVPIDVRIDNGDSFAALAKKLKAEVQQCMRHSHHTVENPRHAPHYEILFNYHNREYNFDFQGTPAVHEWTHSGYGNETFAFQVRNGNHSDAFVLDCDFHCDVFTPEQQEQAVAQLLRVIDAFVSDCHQPISSVSLLSEAETRQLLVEFNQTETPAFEGHGLSEMFELQAAQSPDGVAVVCGGQSLTYAQLNARAKRIASHLRSLGVGPETVVALAMRRGIHLLSGILGVFKAGGAYLPLDPSWPPQRCFQVLAQSRTPLVLVDSECQPSLAQSLPEALGTDCPKVECLEGLLEQEEPQPDSIGLAPSNLAYVIYTSGSTGVPKGVMVQHGGMMNHLYAKIRDLQLTSKDVIAQTASQCFDISVWQFLAALLVGGQVNIVDDSTVHDPTRLREYLRRHGITVFEAVPSLLSAMLDHSSDSTPGQTDLPSLRWLLSTGEGLPPQLAERWLRSYPDVPMCNAYGPTECSDDVSHYFMHDGSPIQTPTVPIGRPIANTRLYVLDDQYQPVPVGVAGELCVSGAGVGRGYLDNPARTAELFVPDPFGGPAGARLYRTGDLARYDASGTLELLGRIDDQIKIRGFRMELGEIETVLARLPGVRAAVVIVREDRSGQRYLAAYVVPDPGGSPAIAELRAFLKERLPESMIPAVFMLLEALPLTAHGKVDRRALPAPEQARAGFQDNFVSPRDGWELRLSRVWEEILDTHPVGVRDNFFDLGGHSLLAVRLMFQIHKMSGRELPLALLFERPTIEQLAQVLRQEIQISVSSLVPIQPMGSNPPLFFVHAHGGGAIAYYALAQQLGREQPFYGLEAPGLDGLREPLSEIPEMASHYVGELRRIQPHGPYCLGGHSFGGLVAFEMARQLAKQGDEVSMLAILDTAAPVAGNTPFDATDFLATSDDATALVEMAGLIERVVRKGAWGYPGASLACWVRKSNWSISCKNLKRLISSRQTRSPR